LASNVKIWRFPQDSIAPQTNAQEGPFQKGFRSVRTTKQRPEALKVRQFGRFSYG
jgi:hypothetical protein